MAVAYLRSPYISPTQLHVSLSRVKKSWNVLLSHKPEHTPSNVSVIYLMPVTVANPLLGEDVDLLAGTTRTFA